MALFKTRDYRRVSMTSTDELDIIYLDAAELADANRLDYRTVRSAEIFYIRKKQEI